MTSSQELMVKNVGHSGVMQMSNVYEQWPFSFPQYHYIRGDPERGLFGVLEMGPPVFYLSALRAAGYLLEVPSCFLLFRNFLSCSSLYLSPAFALMPYFSPASTLGSYTLFTLPIHPH